MFLPLSDSPNPGRRAYVTWALIALNVAVYVFVTLPQGLMSVDPSDPLLREVLRVMGEGTDGRHLGRLAESISAWNLTIFRFGFRASDPSVLTLFTSLFMHAGLLHLVGNMLFLHIFGDNVEERLGRLTFLLAYLGTGIAATLLHMLLDPSSPLPMVGASGAISGVLGFYFVWFPQNRVRVLALLFPFLMDVITVPARWVLGAYVVLDNLLPLLLTAGEITGGVAYGAHIGGFVAGFLLAHAADRRTGSEAADVAETERFARVWLDLPDDRARVVLPARDVLDIATHLERARRPETALALYRRLLALQPAGRIAGAAHLAAGRVLLDVLGRPVPARQHFLDALDVDPSADVQAAAREGLAREERLRRRLVQPRRPGSA